MSLNSKIIRCADLSDQALELITLLQRYTLQVQWLALNTCIPGSYWGDSEAGLVKNTLMIRPDTPIHSALHEACHYVCMTPSRRLQLHTDAGGDDHEENAVCYLQILLADYLPGVGRQRLMQDMDVWGYSFRLSSAHAWFEHDANDAYAWLLKYDLIDEQQRPTWRLRLGNG